MQHCFVSRVAMQLKLLDGYYDIHQAAQSYPHGKKRVIAIARDRLPNTLPNPTLKM